MENGHHAELVWSNSVETEKIELSDSELDDRMYEKFGISDARELVRKASNKPVGASFVTFIVRTPFVTLEAQNALLKILEEPPVSTKFVFVLPSGLSILSTLRSRFNVSDSISSTDEKNDIFAEFKSAEIKERLALIEKTAKAKDTNWQREIKKGLIQYISDSGNSSDSLCSMEYVAKTLLTRGASNKMLLEQVALML